MMKPRILGIAAILVSMAATTAIRAQELEWDQTFGNSGEDGAWGIELTSDGGTVATGFFSTAPYGPTQIYLVKTDAAGNFVWSQTYGGPADDTGASVRELPDGGFVIAGRIEQGGAFDMALLRTDSSGNLIWQRTFDLGDDERAHDVCPTPDGGFLLAGQAWIMNQWYGSYDVYLVKTNANGDLQWERTYAREDSGNDVALSVEPTIDGDFIVGAFTQSTAWASYVLRIDPLGEPVWERTYHTNFQNECYSILPLADGTFVMTGAYATGDSNVMLTKLAANGDVIWNRQYGGNNDDDGQCVRQTEDGGFIIGGMTSSFGSGQWDVYLVRTDSEGNLEWAKTFGGPWDDRGHSVRVAPDGDLLLAGWAWSFGEGMGDLYLLRVKDGESGAATDATLGEPASDPSLLTLRAWPNPSRGATTLGLELGRAGWAEIDIIDAAGRLVRGIAREHFTAGDHTLFWDGRDEGSKAISSGVYFARLRFGDREETRRLTLLR